ncbi:MULTISPECIES: radical SAM protein [Metallosphaera]|uniref:Radical SAM protein n=1 Tax=Metallosphaera prunae TaxID=47304 RepID=A0A4D8RWK0_METPR|nr:MULTISPECIES: radical SAM protein [Metallosphaera]MCH1771909.1 radical SAM protein [Metallosphaera sedula]MCP6728569.1 radical SAM protein [Metallosphaera sedula]QCO29377.1 radical SAM protein [Metallosphaera prunae]
MIREIEVKSALTKSGLRELDYSLNPYLGCRFSCSYCYARYFSPREVGERWGEVILVKKNLLEVLRKEVKVKRKGVVGISTITDPYQPVERNFRLTRESLKLLLEGGFRVSIQTKSPLVLRDLDILTRYRERVDVGVTVTTMSPEEARQIEPLAPLPQARIETLKELKENGVEVWMFLGPVIPGHNFFGVLEEAGKIGVRVIYDVFNYYPGLPFRSVSKNTWKQLEEQIRKMCEELGVQCHSEQEDWIYETKRRYNTLF